MKFKISQDPIEVREYLEAQGFSLFKRRGIEKKKWGSEGRSNRPWFWNLTNPAEVYRKPKGELWEFIIVEYKLHWDQEYNSSGANWSYRRAFKMKEGLKFIAAGYAGAILSSFRLEAGIWSSDTGWSPFWHTCSIGENEFHGRINPLYNPYNPKDEEKFKLVKNAEKSPSMCRAIQETRQNGLKARIIFT